MHAADFDELDRADGRRVLVVGPGNSGVDLVNHLLDGGATELSMSARHGMNILPERMFGLPTHPMAVAGRRLPSGMQDAMMRTLQRIAFGDLTELVDLDEFGFPQLDGNHRDTGLPGLWFFGIDRDPYGNLSVLRAEARRFRKEFESFVNSQQRARQTMRSSDSTEHAA
jgi:cation diffusion facilitator CzcD-associated flavoprotein CzcO